MEIIGLLVGVVLLLILLQMLFCAGGAAVGRSGWNMATHALREAKCDVVIDCEIAVVANTDQEGAWRWAPVVVAAATSVE